MPSDKGRMIYAAAIKLSSFKPKNYRQKLHRAIQPCFMGAGVSSIKPALCEWSVGVTAVWSSLPQLIYPIRCINPNLLYKNHEFKQMFDCPKLTKK